MSGTEGILNRYNQFIMEETVMVAAKAIVPQSGSDARVTFFDNLRYLLVFGVVIQHASMAYSKSGWWPVDDGLDLIATFFLALFDGFLMPCLFYIAGYFAIPSIQKRSIPLFVQGKLKRLGIPWLVSILFICPLLPLVYHYTRDGFRLSESYGSTWLAVMKNAVAFDFGILPPMSQIMQNDLFYQRYMWFISVLLFFFLLFSVLYKVRKSWFEPKEPPFKSVSPSVRSTLTFFFTIGFITFFGSVVLIGIMFFSASGVSNPESWFTFGNIVQFRVSRVFLHVTYFTLGILTFKWKWIERGKFPGHLKTWVIAFLMILVPFYASRASMLFGPPELKQLFGLVFWFCLNFFTISVLGLSSSLAIKYCGRTTPLSQNLAANSYNIYLVHYPLVIGFQLLFLILPGVPVLLKFVLVIFLSLVIGYGVSQFLIRRYPGKTVAVLATLFLIMIITIRP